MRERQALRPPCVLPPLVAHVMGMGGGAAHTAVAEKASARLNEAWRGCADIAHGDVIGGSGFS